MRPVPFEPAGASRLRGVGVVLVAWLLSSGAAVAAGAGGTSSTTDTGGWCGPPDDGVVVGGVCVYADLPCGSDCPSYEQTLASGDVVGHRVCDGGVAEVDVYGTESLATYEFDPDGVLVYERLYCFLCASCCGGEPTAGDASWGVSSSPTGCAEVEDPGGTGATTSDENGSSTSAVDTARDRGRCGCDGGPSSASVLALAVGMAARRPSRRRPRRAPPGPHAALAKDELAGNGGSRGRSTGERTP